MRFAGLWSAAFALAFGCAAQSAASRSNTDSHSAAAPTGQETRLVAPPVASEGGTLLRNATLIDGTGAAPKKGVDVLVQGERIVKVGPGLVAPNGAREIDLGGRVLLPGFIDAHVHLTSSPPPSYEAGVTRRMKQTDADLALQGVANARVTLRAGFTTVRNVGGGFADRSLRDAIRGGRVAGPRMLVANHAIGITGGHCDHTNTFRPDAFPNGHGYQEGVVDGAEEVRKAVRYQIKHGADVIKLCATGGVMSQGDTVGAAQLTVAEMTAAVDEARRAERKVAAHAHGNQGIRDAIASGVDSIEHGSILDTQTVALMKKRKTFLVPTLYVASYVEARAKEGTISKHSAGKALDIAPKMRKSFQLAIGAGVNVALGSDAGVFAHGENGKEFAAMVGQGMKPLDAIVAGTSAAAQLLGLSDVGRVAPGALADLVVVDGDPLQDITVLEAPKMVMKGGALHVAPAWESGGPT